ncbi:MAG: hypothetical protein ACUVWV_05210 [Thermodesulfobacteriota bacterium]
MMKTSNNGQKRAKIFWILPIGMALLGFWGGCEQVSKPEIRKEGPLQIIVPAGTSIPEYHTPAERWRIQHSKAINQKDFSEGECLLCHNPQTGCQKCHKYVGAKDIKLPETSIFWANREKNDE